MSARSEGKWQLALAALLVSPSVAEASRRSGIARRTLERWLANPKFQERLAAAYRTVVASAVRQLQQNMGRAADALVKVLDDPTATAADRIRAAKAILDGGLSGQQQLDIIPELQRLIAKDAATDRQKERDQ